MIDKFDISRFDNSLPRKNGQKLFVHVGTMQGEHCWEFVCSNPQLKILVRSSIDSSGVSAEKGEDSIRLILCYLFTETCDYAVFSEDEGKQYWRPISKGVDAYTTRVKGWEKRLKEKLYLLAMKAHKVKGTLAPWEQIAFSNNPKYLDRPFAHREGHFLRWLD